MKRLVTISLDIAGPGDDVTAFVDDLVENIRRYTQDVLRDRYPEVSFDSLTAEF